MHLVHLPLKMSYFNSIKVQLKRTQGEYELGATVGFQFHKGTIKTCLRSENTIYMGISIP